MEIKIKVGPEHGVNVICIPDDLFPGSSDGDTASFQGHGTIVEHDGKKYISVDQVNGEDVEELPDSPDENHSQDKSEMDSEDALDSYMKNKE